MQSRLIGHEGEFRERSYELRKSPTVPFKKNLCKQCGRIEVEDQIHPLICAFKQPSLILREKLNKNHNWAMTARVTLQDAWSWSLQGKKERKKTNGMIHFLFS